METSSDIIDLYKENLSTLYCGNLYEKSQNLIKDSDLKETQKHVLNSLLDNIEYKVDTFTGTNLYHCKEHFYATFLTTNFFLDINYYLDNNDKDKLNLNQEDEFILKLLALGHDLNHDGNPNGTPMRLEKRSVEVLDKFYKFNYDEKGLDDKYKAIILSTDVQTGGKIAFLKIANGEKNVNKLGLDKEEDKKIFQSLINDKKTIEMAKLLLDSDIAKSCFNNDIKDTENLVKEAKINMNPVDLRIMFFKNENFSGLISPIAKVFNDLKIEILKEDLLTSQKSDTLEEVINSKNEDNNYKAADKKTYKKNIKYKF